MEWFYIKLKVKTMRDHYVLLPFYIAPYLAYRLYKIIIRLARARGGDS